MVNPLNLLKQVGNIRQQASAIQKELENKVVEEVYSGIRLKMNGKMEVLNLEIEESLLSPQRKRELEKGLKDCWNKAVQEIQTIISKDLQGKLGVDLPI